MSKSWQFVNGTAQLAAQQTPHLSCGVNDRTESIKVRHNKEDTTNNDTNNSAQFKLLRRNRFRSGLPSLE